MMGKDPKILVAKEIKKLERGIELDEKRFGNYSPNFLAKIRDITGFGRVDFSLHFYGIQLIICVAGYFLIWPENAFIYFLFQTELMRLMLAIGLSLHLKYPTTKEYRFRGFAK